MIKARLSGDSEVQFRNTIQGLYNLGSLLSRTSIWDLDQADFGDAIMNNTLDMARFLGIELDPSPEEQEEEYLADLEGE